MTRLAELKKGDWEQFERLLHNKKLQAEHVLKLNANPDVIDCMIEAMFAHPAFQLIHGRFHSLQDKLEKVRSYPGVTEEMIREAVEDAQDRIALFEKESPCTPLLNIVVCVYKDSAHETLKYVRDRMRETHGDKFWQWDRAYAKGLDENRVRYLQDANGRTIVPIHKNCIRIEVVDLGANWNKQNGMIPRDVRGANSAHAAVIFAAAQDPEWVRQMDGKKVPYALAGGFELNVPDYGRWAHVPRVYRSDDESFLHAYWYDGRFHGTSLPFLRE